MGDSLSTARNPIQYLFYMTFLGCGQLVAAHDMVPAVYERLEADLDEEMPLHPAWRLITVSVGKSQSLPFAYSAGRKQFCKVQNMCEMYCRTIKST